ncbi:MAG: hypothetical protein FWG96_02115, partial [Methanomassiliicoccaceae archaeon]|nr:hypothetical protein [Methanomassiliicoccaceae archaeon]
MAVVVAIAVLPLFSIASVAPASYSFVDENGQHQNSPSSTQEISTNGNDLTLTDGWYIVTQNVAYNGLVTIVGDVKLIIADGSTLTLYHYSGENVVIDNGASLTAYNQSGDTGKIHTSTSFAIHNGRLVNTSLIEMDSSTTMPVVRMLSPGGVLDNYGTLSGLNATSSTYVTVRIDSGSNSTVNNYGTITSTVDNTRSSGLSCESSSAVINNYGTIRSGSMSTGAYGYGVICTVGCTLNNYNQIFGGGYGRGISMTGGGIPLDLYNSGTVRGGITVSNTSGTVNNVTFAAGSDITGTLGAEGGGSFIFNFVGDPGPALTYCNVSNVVSLLNSTARIDASGLSSPLKMGDTLYLIKSIYLGINPEPGWYSDDGYTFDISVAGTSLIAKVTGVPSSWGIGLDQPGTYTFPPDKVNYPPQSELEVTVTNIGDTSTGNLSVTLSGTDASAFTLSTGSLATILIGSSSKFTVVPHTGLPLGTYTATVTVGPAAGNSKPVAPKSFGVSFTVTDNAAAQVPYTKVDGTTGYHDALRIDQDYFDNMSGDVLNDSNAPDGWYYVEGNITISNLLLINSNVHIIIGNNFTVVLEGNPGIHAFLGDLAVYSQPVVEGSGDVKGRMVSSRDNVVNVFEHRSFTNTATINNIGTDTYGVFASGPSATIINGVTGIIQGDIGIGLKFDGTIENYGMVFGGNGADRYGIYAAESSTVTNYQKGTIQGGFAGICLNAGGTITNSGEVAGDTYGILSVSNTAPVTLTNGGTVGGDVKLTDAKNNVTFVKGSVINGDFNIGSSTDSTMTFTGKLTLGDNFTYSFVNGIANIGNATAKVSFVEMPNPYAGGKIILIDTNGRTVSGTPANEWFSAEGNNFMLIAENDQLFAIPCNVIDVSIQDGNGTVEVSSGGTSYGTIAAPGGTVVLPKTITSVTFTAVAGAGYGFVKLIIDGKDVRINPVTLSINDNMTCMAYFTDDLSDLLVMTLVQTGGAGATLSYTLNGNDYPYSAPFTVQKSIDNVSISASAYGIYEFVRWQDSDGNILSTTPSPGSFDLSGYGSAVTMTAVFAASGGRITVTLTSEPAGAVLFYTISGLNEVQYTASFQMERSESLSLKADAYAGYGFLRWEGPGGMIIGTTAQMTNMSLPPTGATAAYNAVYAASGDLLIITMTQTGGAGATLSYALNGVDYLYSTPFTVRKSADRVSLSASSYGSYDGVRWQDDIGNILSLTPVSGNLDLLVYGSAVTITAVFAEPGGRVIVTLTSEPAGAILFYTISGLNEVQYTEPFPMSRSETLSIRASATNGTYDFLRWEVPAGSIIGTNEVVTNMPLPSTGVAVTYKAVYATSSDTIEVTLAQTGGAGATLTYVLNGIEYPYSAPFTVLRTDSLSPSANAYGSYEFVRWQDSDGNILSTIPSPGSFDLSGYGSAVTMTAVFAASGGRITVTLTSEPTGAILFYTIPGLNEVQYTASFPMSRDETLSIRASPAIGTYGFLRWEGPDGIIGTNETVTGLSLPSTGTTAAYKAVYASATGNLTITLTQTGGAGAALSYTVNGTTYAYGTPFTVLRTDTVSVSASGFGSYALVRWQDDLGNIIGMSENETLDMSMYGLVDNVELTVVFATTAEVIEITLEKDGNPGASLAYTVNNSAYTYTAPFVVLRTDTVTISVSDFGTYSFVRWQDDLGNIIGVNATETLDLSLYSGVGTAEITAFFTASGGRVMVTLTSEPTGAVLFYTISGLNEVQYTEPFPMSRSETLSVRASATNGTYDFLRWEGPGGLIIGTSETVTPISLPSSGTTATYKAVYATSSDTIEVTLAQTGGAGATLTYVLNGIEYPYSAPFTVLRTDSLSPSANAYGSYEF